MFGPPGTVTLAWQGLFIKDILFLGVPLTSIVGDVLGSVAVLIGLAGVLVETVEWPGIVTVIPSTFRDG